MTDEPNRLFDGSEVTFYYLTTRGEADTVLRAGFRDNATLVDRERAPAHAVCLSECPLIKDDPTEVTLIVRLVPRREDFVSFAELVGEHSDSTRRVRLWYVSAAVLNSQARVVEDVDGRADPFHHRLGSRRS